MAKDLFNRYIWLVDIIYRSGKITFEEINERWLRTEMSDGQEIPLRTFHNHRKAIEELFDINIECNKKGGYTYYIENREDMERGGVRNWLLNTFAVNNLINESHKLKRRILFEDIPSGRQYLTPIIEAMRGNLVLQMTYQSYWSDEPKTFEIEPYCVKVFRQRWYVVANNPALGCLRIYSLDRIQQLSVTEEEKTFQIPGDFDPQLFFQNNFGITIDDELDIERIRLRVYGTQRKYFRALPIHPTQEEVETTSEYSDFQYLFRPSYDFYQEILSHGNKVEVLKPEWLREDIYATIKEMEERYTSS